MFNLINKNSGILSILVLGGIFFVVFQNTNAASMREDYPRYWLKASTNNVANMVSSWTKAVISYESSKYDLGTNAFTTDIFGDNASKYRVKKQEESLYGIETVKGKLKAEYPNCDMKETELIAILFHASGTGIYLKDEIIKTVPKAQWPKIEDRDKGCKNLTTCMLGKDMKLTNTACESKVRNAYVEGEGNKRRSLLLEESNLGAEKYYNGSLDDSSYDVFYDIGQVAKIFYEDVAPVTQSSIIFYKMPSFGKGSSGNGGGEIGSSTTTNNGTNNGGSSIKNQGTNKGNGGLGSQGNLGNSQGNKTNQGSNQGGIQGNIQGNNVGNNGGTRVKGGVIPSVTDDDELNSLINNGTQEQRTMTNNGNTAYVNKCVVSGSPKLEEAYLAAEEEEDEGPDIIPSPLDISEEYVEELIEDIIENSNKIRQTTRSPLTGENQKETYDDVPGGTLAGTDAGVVDELRKQLSSCVDKCDGLRLDEKAICKAKCLCSEYSSKAMPKNSTFQFLKEGALRIRICNIPSKAVIATTSTKSVVSIETILAEIHDTIKALFTSGELTPKMKKQEWLDSSLNNIKFSDVVNFNIGMKFKRPVVERDVKKEELQEFQNKLQDEILDINSNSFNVMQDLDSALNAATTLSKTTEAPKTDAISESTDSLINQNRLASITMTFQRFVETHETFLTTLTDVMNEMTKTIAGRLK